MSVRYVASVAETNRATGAASAPRSANVQPDQLPVRSNRTQSCFVVDVGDECLTLGMQRHFLEITAQYFLLVKNELLVSWQVSTASVVYTHLIQLSVG